MIRTEAQIRQALRDWIVTTSEKISPQLLTDQTAIMEQRLISSLQVMDLILCIEALSGQPVDVATLRPGVFRNIDAIYQNFFAGV